MKRQREKGGRVVSAFVWFLPDLYSSSVLNHFSNRVLMQCMFNGCTQLVTGTATKCNFHRNRRRCTEPGCKNQVYARSKCVRHGGKRQCTEANCTLNARGGSKCLRHGGHAVKRYCLVEGCQKQAHARSRCVKHGGGRKCKIEGCVLHARTGGLCARHSSTAKRCDIPQCDRMAQHGCDYCFSHLVERRAFGQIDVTTKATKTLERNNKASGVKSELLINTEAPPHATQQENVLPSNAVSTLLSSSLEDFEIPESQMFKISSDLTLVDALDCMGSDQGSLMTEPLTSIYDSSNTSLRSKNNPDSTFKMLNEQDPSHPSSLYAHPEAAWPSFLPTMYNPSSINAPAPLNTTSTYGKFLPHFDIYGNTATAIPRGGPTSINPSTATTPMW